MPLGKTPLQSIVHDVMSTINLFFENRFADTFDDVISTAVATKALASGNDGSALRGGVVA